jgi:hypothetical protein
MTPLPLALSISFLFLSHGSNPNSLHFDFDSPFREGLRHRADAATARPYFAEAARGYDLAWQSGLKTRDRALNRGRAHYLAGNLPQAIRAFRDGLELDPWDAGLQHGLAVCRAAVAYPTETEPAERVRPDPPTSLRHRLSPWDLFAAASIASLLVVVGAARRLTAADGWAVPVAGLGLAGLLAVGVATWLIEQDRAYDREYPVVVLTGEATLRTGNGPTFAPRLEAFLPRGAEVRELGQRGGWVQVELAGGAVGWLPEAVLLR